MATTNKRARRAPHSWTTVRLPDRPLHERVLEVAAPLLDHLGPQPSPEETRKALELAVEFWNAKVRASKLWERPNTKPWRDLQRAASSKKARPEDSEAFAVLVQRWDALDLVLEPRLVAQWSFDTGPDGSVRLSCEMALPDRVQAMVMPPEEKRIAINGKYLDEVSIRSTQSVSSGVVYRSHPFESHHAAVDRDGHVAIHTPMATAAALLAAGTLPPVGGRPVDLLVGGKSLEGMEFRELRISASGLSDAQAALLFEPSSTTGQTS